MKALYVSDDGKFFTTPEECMEYESKQNGYMVEVIGDSGDYHFKQGLTNKQNCQHFVAKYIHQHFEGLTEETFEDFLDLFYDTKITVRHKGNEKSYMLIDLIEEVPAHYKINSDRFHDLIR